MAFASMQPLRLVALGVVASAVLAATAQAEEQTRNPHHEAVQALSDIDAAIDALNSASNMTANNAGPYRHVAQRASAAILGTGGRESRAGDPSDGAGALGHLAWLAAHGAGSVWGPAVQGVITNLRVAEAHLAEAAKVDQLDEFWLQTSPALQSLLVAEGRPSQLGVLGGMRGALATTDLGLPPDAKIVSGCAAPTEVPSFGVTKGYLTYLAVPRDEGTVRLPETIGVRDVSVRGNGIVLHTAATALIGQLCPELQPAVATTTDPVHSGDVAALYTEQQAQQGKQVFDNNCASCHGKNLQGSSAPPVGGTAFLKKAKMLDWSVADMRNLVVTAMPASNPGSLSPKQYADVLAYLLAVDCYPPGDKSFPTSATSSLKQTELHPIKGAKDEESKTDTCPVKG
jgi:polar amino acid transport system substrate-binding protein